MSRTTLRELGLAVWNAIASYEELGNAKWHCSEREYDEDDDGSSHHNCQVVVHGFSQEDNERLHADLQAAIATVLRQWQQQLAQRIDEAQQAIAAAIHSPRNTARPAGNRRHEIVRDLLAALDAVAYNGTLTRSELSRVLQRALKRNVLMHDEGHIPDEDWRLFVDRVRAAFGELAAVDSGALFDALRAIYGSGNPVATPPDSNH